MPRRTNLIDGKIQDVYMYLLNGLKDLLHHHRNDKLQEGLPVVIRALAYFLLNEEMARRPHLISSPDGKDVYMYLLSNLKDLLHHGINHKFQMDIIESN
ncbi:unnamed protein product [Sphenostylis stenocarpa]|uniref:Uncharacterized protein n=1 Tax=Sphenostylis stenocarpa TaxID=92480 RepID=A0AA86VB46_9FABA|nr:unnamed protein product [Sphenostylis stenocarpa]